jgi:hypothetical protein
MGRREAIPVARRIYYDPKEGLYPYQKFSLTLRAGYLLRALDYGRIRLMSAKPGDHWSLGDIRAYAKELVEYVSDISRHPGNEAARKELRRLGKDSRELCSALGQINLF